MSRFVRFRVAILLAALSFLGGCAAFQSASAPKKPVFAHPLLTNARVQTQWPGTYQGILPCSRSGCSGIATMLVLFPDQKFTLRTRHLPLDIKDTIRKDSFTWLNGNTIKLNGLKDNTTNTLRVDNGAVVFESDDNAELIQGADPEAYVLKKTSGVPTPPPKPPHFAPRPHRYTKSSARAKKSALRCRFIRTKSHKTKKVCVAPKKSSQSKTSRSSRAQSRGKTLKKSQKSSKSSSSKHTAHRRSHS